MNKHLIIFDFDGVLADSFDVFYPLIRDGMASIGLELTQSQYRDFFIGNVHQSFKNFINNESKYSKFSKFRENNYDKYYYGKNNNVKLFPGTLNFLKRISKNHALAIVSSGRRDNIIHLLKKKGVMNLFSLIFADKSYTKEGRIGEVLNKLHIKAGEALMISDTVGDITTAKKMGLKTIAVTWGFQSATKLKKYNPDTVAKNFKELLIKINKPSL